MSYHDRDWYNNWRKEQEASNASSVPAASSQAAPHNPYKDALRRHQKPSQRLKTASRWHAPSIFLGAFLAFLLIFVLNGFRFWFR
jgi:hypothetical protein